MQASTRLAGRTFLLVTLALFAANCGGDSSGTAPDPNPDPPVATSIMINPASPSLTALGATVQLTAAVRDQFGNAMTGAAVQWSSSDPAVASVSASGLVTALAVGNVTVTASSGSATQNAALAVTQAVSSVVVTPPDAVIAPSETVQLEGLSVQRQEGGSYDPEGEIRYQIDVVLRDGSGRTRAVLDTKYKDVAVPPSADVAQVVSYAAAQRCSHAVLVYPHALALPKTFRVGDVRVSVVAFPLNVPFEAGGRQLVDCLADAGGTESRHGHSGHEAYTTAVTDAEFAARMRDVARAFEPTVADGLGEHE